VNNLNAAARDNPQLGQMPLEHLLERLGELPEAIRTVVRRLCA
jgi:hypothetical protein